MPNKKEKRLYPSEFRKYCKEVCQFLRTYIFHGEYQMDISYFETIESNGRGMVNDPNAVTAAAIRIDPTYLNFDVQISRQVFEAYKKKDWWFIGSMFVHEFSHLLTEPIYLLAVNAVTNNEVKHLEDIRERQTQRVANVILYALREVPNLFEPGAKGRKARDKTK